MSYLNRTFTNETPSKCRKGGRRACLCRNNTYSRRCCDGTLRGQGIGPV